VSKTIITTSQNLNEIIVFAPHFIRRTMVLEFLINHIVKNKSIKAFHKSHFQQWLHDSI